MDEHKRHHSFFWPTLLIGAGVVWLLVNFGLIEPISIGTVLRFWPVLLIVLGLDVLFGRRYAWAGSVIGLVAIAAVVVYLIYGTSAGTIAPAQSRVETFTAPVGEATSVEYNFDTSSEPVKMYALDSSDQLIDATVAYQGTMTFSVDGTDHKTVHLYEDSLPSSWLTWDFSFENRNWDIGLNPDVATDITLDGGSGSLDLNLSGLQLQTLTADLGSGSSDFTLPETSEPQMIKIGSGSGSVHVRVPAATTVTLQLDSGSGSVAVDLPADAEFRIEVMNDGSGSLHLPSEATRVSGDIETGAWETSGYATAANPILIQILDRGSGSIWIN